MGPDGATETEPGSRLRFRVQGLRFRFQGSGFRVQGSGFKVESSGYRVYGLWCGAAPFVQDAVADVTNGSKVTAVSPWSH